MTVRVYNLRLRTTGLASILRGVLANRHHARCGRMGGAGGGGGGGGGGHHLPSSNCTSRLSDASRDNANLVSTAIFTSDEISSNNSCFVNYKWLNRFEQL